jgi:hypothetical protein
MWKYGWGFKGLWKVLQHFGTNVLFSESGKVELFENFLVNYSYSLNLKKNIANYSYFGNCPRSKTFYSEAF